MNEQLNSNSTRPSDLRNSEQVYAGEQRERATPQPAVGQARKCGLDTGARGWRYVYQTH